MKTADHFASHSITRPAPVKGTTAPPRSASCAQTHFPYEPFLSAQRSIPS
jgi:hypothetical protein